MTASHASSCIRLLSASVRYLPCNALGIRRSVFKNVDELIAAIDDYIAARNQNPKPFAWTATAELILDPRRRYL